MNHKPINLCYLAFKNLRRKFLRSVCLLLVIAVFVFALFTGGLLNESLRGGLAGIGQRMGADILVVPYGYEKNLQVALLRGEPSTFYLKADLTQKITRIPGVAAASPQLFLASLGASCCTAKVQLIGYDPDTDFIISPWIESTTGEPLRSDEVVVGAKILRDVGNKIMFFSRKFNVAAKMDRTGMGFDTSVFMPLKSAYQLAQQSDLIEGDREAIKDFISSIAVKIKPGFEARDVANEISQTYAMEYNLDIVVAKSMLTDLAGKLQNFSYIIYGLSFLLLFLAVFVLFVVFSASLNERKREIALLRILGASRMKLAGLVVIESLLLGLAGTCMGISLAGVGSVMFGNLIFLILGLPHVALGAGKIFLYGVISFCVGLMVVPLSNIYSVFAITSSDSYSILREGE